LQHGAADRLDTVCFLVQQCVEKYVKALIVVQGAIVPKTHDLGHLLNLLPESMRPVLSTAEQLKLATYAVETRYPGGETVTLTEARAAVRLARRVRRQVRRMLPRRALGRPKRPAAPHPTSKHPR